MSQSHKHHPKVSIITIVFNGQKSIERTIKSVLAQRYPNIEYIIIDGGSTDGTIDVIKKYRDRIAYWMSEPDKGIADAFNKGLRQAKGEIIGFINSDDWYNEDTVSKVVPHFERYSVVYGDVQFWDNGKKQERTFGNHKKLNQGMTIAHPAVFVKKEVYEKFGGFNISFKIAMDYEFIAKLYHNGISFFNIDTVIVNMNVGGLSDRKWVQAFLEERKVKERYQGKMLSYYFFLKQCLLFPLSKLYRRYFKF